MYKPLERIMNTKANILKANISFIDVHLSKYFC